MIDHTAIKQGRVPPEEEKSCSVAGLFTWTQGVMPRQQKQNHRCLADGRRELRLERRRSKRLLKDTFTCGYYVKRRRCVSPSPGILLWSDDSRQRLSQFQIFVNLNSIATAISFWYCYSPYCCWYWQQLSAGP